MYRIEMRNPHFLLAVLVTTVIAYPVRYQAVSSVTNNSKLSDPDLPSFGFNISLSDLHAAKIQFKIALDNVQEISLVYFYLYSDRHDFKNLDKKLSKRERNGLQEWIWVKRESIYFMLTSPVDMDILTFSISKYGTEQIDIPFKLSTSCHSNETISYDKETNHIVDILYKQVIENFTGSYLCHRSFNDTSVHISEAIYWIFTVWIGYDFNCYGIDSLMSNLTVINKVSKLDISKILTIVLGIVGYMHPLLCHILEATQPTNTEELLHYDKTTSKHNKPYGYRRFMRKLFFNAWQDESKRKEFRFRYAPVVRFYFLLTLLIIALNLYRWQYHKNTKLSNKGMPGFAHIYRFGIPEYQECNQITIHVISIISFFVMNIWIYIMYNESDDFVICFHKDICVACTCIGNIGCCLEQCKSGQKLGICRIPVNKILNVEDDHDSVWLLTTSKKLILRFCLLFRLNFWRFLFTYSTCSLCCRCDPKSKTLFVRSVSCVCFVLYNIIIGMIIFIINSVLNILFCLLPALWYVVFFFIKLYDAITRDLNEEKKSYDKSRTKLSDTNTTEEQISLYPRHIPQTCQSSEKRPTETPINLDNPEQNGQRNMENTMKENKMECITSWVQATLHQECKHTFETKTSPNWKKKSNNDFQNQAYNNDTDDEQEGKTDFKDKSEGSSESIINTSTDSAKGKSKDMQDQEDNENTQSAAKSLVEAEVNNGFDVHITNINPDDLARNEHLESTGKCDEHNDQINCYNSTNPDQMSHVRGNHDDRVDRKAKKKYFKISKCARCVFCLVFKIVLGLWYIISVRVHVSYFVFISRSFSYTVIVGFAVSEYLWRWYIVVILGFGYLLSFVAQYRESYDELLETIFEIDSERATKDENIEEKKLKRKNSILL